VKNKLCQLLDKPKGENDKTGFYLIFNLLFNNELKIIA